MNLKKNAFSYAIWMMILLFAGAVFSFFGMVIANLLDMNKFIVAIVVVAGFFGILFLIYFLTGIVVDLQALSKPVKYLENVKPIVEKIVLCVGVLAGLLLRIYMLPAAGEEAAYFEVAKVTDSSGILVQSVQGSVYYYCMLLHGLFLMVGNHWIAGIWLQIILQLIGFVIFYFAVKKWTDSWPAMLVLAILHFAPSSVEAGITYSPQVLYFCMFALGMLCVSDYMSRSSKAEPASVVMWCYAAFTGIVIGFCAYVDITGFLLLLPMCCLPMIKREDEETKAWLFRGLLLVLITIVTFMAMLLVDAILSGTTFLRVLNAWMVVYGSFESTLEIVTEHGRVDFFVVIAIACLGVFSFWRRKEEERFSPFVLLAFGCGFLCLCGYTTTNMNGSYLLYVLLVALAVVCLTELFYSQPKGSLQSFAADELVVIDLEKQPMVQEEATAKKQPVAQEDVAMKKQPVVQEDVAAKKQPVVQENVAAKKQPMVQEEGKMNKQPENMEEQNNPKPKLIENPLPGPRKHVKKVMDYAFTPEKSKMNYDVQVSDTDDYDL